MTRKEILVKAFDAAMAQGWNWLELPAEDWSELTQEEKLKVTYIISKMPGAVIYEHDFAKALWGEAGYAGEFTGKYPNPTIDKNGGSQKGWRYHLQAMVLADDPIDYILKYRLA